MLMKKVVDKAFFLIFAVILCMICGSCDALDALFPSAGNYKVVLLINDIPLDECSFAKSEDMIRPYFEESVSEDPDISSLIIYLKDSQGEITGEKIAYCLEDDDTPEDASIILVESLDGALPEFKLSADMPKGRYTIIMQVMGGKNVLQRMEKDIFYLGNNYFSYEGINIYLPGVAESSHLIPKESIIMLEADIEFDDSFDPYIVWYEGKRIISQGKFSEGAGSQFWKAPDQSGFFSLHAEVFPVDNFSGLAGYQKRVSLLVSSMDVYVHLVSSNISQLIHWYTFEGNLNDSKMSTAAERSIVPVSGNASEWMGADGTYGIVTGSDNVLRLPKVIVGNDAIKIWQVLFRLKPINDGDFFSIRFGSSNNANLILSMRENRMILTLSSDLDSVSQIFDLPQSAEEANVNAFLTAGIGFTVQPDSLSANINIFGNIVNVEMTSAPISISSKIKDEFWITLGFLNEAAELSDESAEEETESLSTVLWDEFALYYMPPMEILAADLNPVAVENEEMQNE
ncbi:MAG: hypothetical protein FWC01_02165 [Treponema sp.]|nr:hypothetical protein [Treponema sp.]MCL2236862.1 hypothetical protein [Treponema sp.]